ncbi:MAG TPA: hypothetical protein VHE14_00725 [Solirubrobacteraceae bacterium]|nr:hypothetical protein [Solirubrobacteraceae bacterium]
MSRQDNALRWDGGPGHYEVYYLSLTDRGSGCGFWIRYTMVAPLDGEATCSLWFMAMDPNDPSANVGRKASWPAAELAAEADPFSLRVEQATLDERSARGAFEDVAWDLTWEPATRGYQHVSQLLQRAKIAKTILTLPQPALAISGSITWAGRTIELDDAHGGQAHLWGSKHAGRWAWIHANDLETTHGERRPGTFVDGVSVYVPRFGREVGPSTPVVAHVGGADFLSTGPLQVTTNDSHFALTSWSFEANAGGRKLVGDVVARREDLVGVTYHDPDGQLAYCYNSEVATLQLALWDGNTLLERLSAPGRAHFEYAQREPIEGIELAVR